MAQTPVVVRFEAHVPLHLKIGLRLCGFLIRCGVPIDPDRVAEWAARQVKFTVR